MIGRREFITHSAGFGVLPLAGPWVAPNDIAWPDFYKVVYDERFELARSFASRANEYGARLHAVSGDITELWFEDLYHRWRAGPAFLAGITLESSAVQLGYFARDQRHFLHYPTGIATDCTDFGTSQPTTLLSESMTPVRLLSWIIEPRFADPPLARPYPLRFPGF